MEHIRYNLYINQLAVIENGLFPTLDAIDLLLFDFIYHFMNDPNAIRTTIGGVEYVTIRHELVQQQCPILGINHRDTFRKRMLKLVDAELIERYEYNSKENMSLYKRGRLFMIFVTNEQKNGNVPTEIGRGADENRHNNNIKDNELPLNIDKSIYPPTQEKPKRNVFSKPSIKEIEIYCKERNNGIDAEDFFYFYETRGWMVGKSTMKDWHAAIRTWELRRNKDATAKAEAESKAHVY